MPRLPMTSAARMMMGRRFYRPEVAKLPALEKPLSMETTLGEVYDALYTKWAYRRAWLLVPFAYVASIVFNATPATEEQKALVRERDAKLKALEFHQD
ncbi:hypothetical protein DFJ74DRAFT_767605 [Hyaloraphidium curvatum]|nr:hypothetical protein DFJ74DRAFT_767605 [Hyaloraphidium curvatum]